MLANAAGPLVLCSGKGLVFVALEDDVPDFDRVYAGITERIAPIDLGAMQFVRRDSWDVECNWKVYVDNDREFTNNIQEEGVDICERVQVGLASGQYRAGRLCPKREAGVWHFHERLRAVYCA